MKGNKKPHPYYSRRVVRREIARRLKAEAEAGIRSAIRQLESQEQTPDVVSALQVYKDKLTAITRPKEYAPSEITKLMNERNQLDPVKDKEAYDILTNRMKRKSTFI